MSIHQSFWSKLYQCKARSARDTFTQYFSKCGSVLSDEAIKHLQDDITEKEVSDIISSAPSRSAAGIDGIPYEFFKCAHSTFHKHLAVVMTTYYTNPSSLPEWIGSSSISLLHKKGSMRDPAMFRPISLLPTLWKLLSNILTQRLNLYI